MHVGVGFAVLVKINALAELSQAHALIIDLGDFDLMTIKFGPISCAYLNIKSASTFSMRDDVLTGTIQ